MRSSLENRRCCAAALAAFGLAGCGEPATVEEPSHDRARGPNVVLLVSDTTRIHELSAYGYGKPTTPHLERLAREGALFLNAYTTGFWTLPAHASLFTGQYPSEHRATSETNHLRVGADTLAERLRRAGFRTGAFISNPWVSRERGFAQGFESFAEAWNDSSRVGSPDRHNVELASAWIRERVKARERFFAFLNLNMVHLPYSPDASVLAELSPGPRLPRKVARMRQVADGGATLVGAAHYAAEDYEILRELYEAELLMMDRLVEELTRVLEDLAVLDETLLIVTSDHGESIGEHGRLGHVRNMYDTTMRIPLVIRYPRRFAAGSVVNDLVSIVDVFPTVLDVTATDVEADRVSARSLAGERLVRESVIGENQRPLNGMRQLAKAYPGFDASKIDHLMRMLRTQRYKLVWRSNGEHELFDLQVDPGEFEDVAGREPDVLARLVGELETWMARWEGLPLPQSFESTDHRALEELRALGYIE